MLNIDVMNQALLAKWLWKLETEEGLWQSVIKSKYVQNGCISAAKRRPGNSQFWAGVLDVKNIFYNFCRKHIGDGKNTRFLEDWWVGDKPLKRVSLEFMESQKEKYFGG